jgi:hypothetical protein
MWSSFLGCLPRVNGPQAKTLCLLECSDALHVRMGNTIVKENDMDGGGNVPPIGHSVSDGSS